MVDFGVSGGDNLGRDISRNWLRKERLWVKIQENLGLGLTQGLSDLYRHPETERERGISLGITGPLQLAFSCMPAAASGVTAFGHLSPAQ